MVEPSFQGGLLQNNTKKGTHEEDKLEVHKANIVFGMDGDLPFWVIVLVARRFVRPYFVWDGLLSRNSSGVWASKTCISKRTAKQGLN